MYLSLHFVTVSCCMESAKMLIIVKLTFVNCELNFFCSSVSFTCKVFALYVFVVVCGLEDTFYLSLISRISYYCRAKPVLLFGKSILICFEVYRIVNSGFNYKS